MQDHTVTAFYQGKLRHPKYGSIKALQFYLISPDKNVFLEHDFMNWLFPSITTEDNEEHQVKAPVLTSDDLEQFRQHYELRRLFNNSIKIFLQYYGMEVKGNTIQASAHFAQASILWLTNPDLTYMKRIVPLLFSMTLLGEKEMAQSMVDVLTRIQLAFPNYISIEQLKAWQKIIHEAEKQFYLLFDQPLYNYAQFWQQGPGEALLSIKELTFSQTAQANLFIQLMQDKGFHSTKINDKINTLQSYSSGVKTKVFLSKGQFALLQTLPFYLPGNRKVMNGTELLSKLLEN